MSEKAIPADTKTCPMCSAPNEDTARTCRSCGENLIGTGLHPEATMTLTPLQRMTLTAYLEYRHSPPTWRKLFRRSWRRHLILVGLGVAVAGLWVSLGVVEPAVGIAALTAGVLLGDIGMFRRLLHLWPALSQVLDYKRIGELLAEDGGGGSPV